MFIGSNVCVGGLVSHQWPIMPLEQDRASDCSWLVKICVFLLFLGTQEDYIFHSPIHLG